MFKKKNQAKVGKQKKAINKLSLKNYLETKKLHNYLTSLLKLLTNFIMRIST